MAILAPDWDLPQTQKETGEVGGEDGGLASCSRLGQLCPMPSVTLHLNASVHFLIMLRELLQ